MGLDKGYKYNKKYSLYDEFSNLEKMKKINSNNHKINRSTSDEKKVYK